MHQEFRVGDIRPNPYRHIERYPMIPEKVEALEASYERTGYWDNIVVRINADGDPEQAYGHHRLAALINKYGPDHKAHFIVKAFDEAAMLRAMADENGEVYGANAAVDIETLRSLLDAWGDGILPMPVIAPTTRGDARHKHSQTQGPTIEYSPQNVADFFGWPVHRRTQAAIEALEAIVTGGMKVEQFEGVSIRRAHAAAKAVNRAVKHGDATVVTKVRDAVTATMQDKRAGSEAAIQQAGHQAMPRAAAPAPFMTATDTVVQVEAALKFLDRTEIRLKDRSVHPLTFLIEEIAKDPTLPDYDQVARLLRDLAKRASDLAALFTTKQIGKGN